MTPSTMPNTFITLRFIRHSSSSKTDDTAIIQSSGSDRYTLTYTYGDTKTKTPRSVSLSGDGVFRWMRNTIRLLENDQDPFESVQLDLPFMPSVMVKAAYVGDSYHKILDALEFHLDNWPSCAADEDEYADMPALIPITPEPPSQLNNTISPIHTHVDEAHSYYGVHQQNQINNQTRGHHHLFLDEDY